MRRHRPPSIIDTKVRYRRRDLSIDTMILPKRPKTRAVNQLRRQPTRRVNVSTPKTTKPLRASRLVALPAIRIRRVVRAVRIAAVTEAIAGARRAHRRLLIVRRRRKKRNPRRANENETKRKRNARSNKENRCSCWMLANPISIPRYHRPEKSSTKKDRVTCLRSLRWYRRRHRLSSSNNRPIRKSNRHPIRSNYKDNELCTNTIISKQHPQRRQRRIAKTRRKRRNELSLVWPGEYLRIALRSEFCNNSISIRHLDQFLITNSPIRSYCGRRNVLRRCNSNTININTPMSNLRGRICIPEGTIA